MRLALKLLLLLLLVFTALCLSCATNKRTAGAELPENSDGLPLPLNAGALPESRFKESWAYVVAGHENALKSNYPISDVVYFGADVDRYGHVVDIPSRKKLSKFSGRVHVSITCGSAGLTHFILEPESKARKIFVSELLDMASQYDGLNIDMESLPLKDAGNFISFLGELRKGLGKKMLSVCVPARTSENQTYNYVRVSEACDRVFVMAYDEHWSTSAPGPVASLSWCKKVASYALETIGADKLIMGIPFYGRGWGDKSTSRGLIHSTTERIRRENGITQIERENGIPKFKYEVLVTVTVYFEDDYSLAARMKMYEDMGIKYVGFWRLGQESTGVWSLVSLTKR
ncbi:MAG: glycoside hydrolase [Spirochaetaceae bacterium]|jgi:spore germination protein YaaH|nr:glycoside hydrolase [Spirochaetaceae bacterium]